MTELFNKCYDILLKNEGGYVNDPDDSGGETYKGISRNNWPDWNGWAYIDECKKLDSFPKNIPNKWIDSKVKEFYFNKFWKPLKTDNFTNELLILHLFDFAVNAGIGIAIKTLQKAVNVNIDGSIGKQTIEAVNNDLQIVEKYIAQRIEHYNNIIEKRPSSIKYLKGWIKRTNELKFI